MSIKDISNKWPFPTTDTPKLVSYKSPGAEIIGLSASRESKAAS